MPNMSPEIISTVAASAGYAAGLLEQYRAERQATQNAVRLQFEAAGQAIEAADTERQQMKFRRWVGRNATAPLALLAGSVIGLGTYAVTQEPETKFPEPKTKVTLVVDHSGATGLELNGNMPAVDQINTIAEQFVNEDIKGEALVASNGTIDALDIDEIIANEPFGNAPIQQATNQAISKSQNSNVLIITNGNKVGDTQAFADRAEQSDSKVFVVNVETAEQPKNKLQGEQELAEATGGSYWKANEDNLDDVAESVKDTVQPAKQDSDGTSKWPLAVFGAMGVTGLLSIRRRTRKGTMIPNKTPMGE